MDGLPVLLPENPKVLILGSMPSVKSLEIQAYYGNPRNHFWRILFQLFDEEELVDYEDKVSWLKSKGIGLWDTIGSCVRKGSLDANIKDERPNDIQSLVRENPTIHLIGCNGTKSYQVFRKYICLDEQFDKVKVIQLPSTSPIPGRYTKSFAEKVEAWRQISEYLS